MKSLAMVLVMVAGLSASGAAQAGPRVHLWNCLSESTQVSVSAISGVVGWAHMIKLTKRSTKKSLGEYPIRPLDKDAREAAYVGETDSGKIELDIYTAIASRGTRGYRALLKVVQPSGKVVAQQMSCMRTK